MDDSGASLVVSSSTFDAGGAIPAVAAHSMAGGRNVSPHLTWDGVPDGTKSLVITMHDPDAPTGVGFTHWIVFDLDPSVRELEAGAGTAADYPGATSVGVGLNDYGDVGYGGMAPPPGDPAHHYQLSVYALDVERLETPAVTTYPLLQFLLRGHVLAQGTLVGTFAQNA